MVMWLIKGCGRREHLQAALIFNDVTALVWMVGCPNFRCDGVSVFCVGRPVGHHLTFCLGLR